MKRTNSEKKIENPTFTLKIGTINKIKPEAIYYEGKTFISPMIEKPSYKPEIDEIEHNFRKNIKEHLENNSIFADKYILDFNIAVNGITYNKKSFLSFQLTVKQDKEVREFKEVKEKTNSFISGLVFSLTGDIKEHSFAIYKSKK